MIQKNDTPACNMRDTLRTEWFNKQITPSQITERMSKIEIPSWLKADIVQMVEYRKLERCTCPIEQAMFQSVCNHIVKDIMDEERNS